MGAKHEASLKITGRVRLIDTKTGEVLREVDNLEMNVGFEWIKSVIHNTADTEAGVNFMEYTAVGDDNTAPVASQTALISQLGSRIQGTYASGATGICVITATHTAAGAWALVEAGLFSEATGGTMLARVIFTVINLSASDEITVEWTITYS